MSHFPFQDFDIFGQMNQMMSQNMRQMNQMFADPFGMGMNPFGGGNALMAHPGNAMSLGFPMMDLNMMQPNGSGSSFYSSSSMVSFNGGGPPVVYESTHMNHIGPNGVREERKTVRDSRSGLQAMTIGRHINDRGHVIEKKKNHRTGDEEENNEFINIEEEEADQFQQEWQTKAAGAARRQAPMLAITGGGSPSSSAIRPTGLSSHHHISSKDKNKLKVKTNGSPVHVMKEKERKEKDNKLKKLLNGHGKKDM